MKEELKSVITDIQRTYGKDAIMMGSNKDLLVERIPTGILGFDHLSGGGLPRGRWTMIWGPKSAGKTSFSYHCIAKVQENGGTAVYIDAEHGFDAAYAESFGVDLSSLIISKPDTLEEAETIVLRFADKADLIVVDSVTSVATEHELKRKMEEDTMAVIARKLSEFFRKTNPTIGKSKSAVILVNQARTHLGSFISYEEFPGGNALKHYTALILKIWRGSKDDDPYIATVEEVDGKKKTIKTPIGIRARIKADKTKISKYEGGESCFDLYKEEPHIDNTKDLILNTELLGIIKAFGESYTFKDNKYNRNEFEKLVAGDSKLYDELMTEYVNMTKGVNNNDDEEKK